MPDDGLDLNGFIIALCEAPYRWIKDGLEGLTDEQLFHQPTTDTNSIAWLIWHLSRWRDKISAAIVGEPEVWTGQGWHRKFGQAADRTGLGDSLEQVAAFRVERKLLQGAAGGGDRIPARFQPSRLEGPGQRGRGLRRAHWANQLPSRNDGWARLAVS